MKRNIYFKCLLGFILPILFMLLIVNLMYYFDIINNNIVKFLKIFVVICSSFITGIIRGYNSINKGYINGIKLSSIIVIFLFIISILLNEFNIKDIIYYIIIILSVTFGAMVGINKKKN